MAKGSWSDLQKEVTAKDYAETIRQTAVLERQNQLALQAKLANDSLKDNFIRVMTAVRMLGPILEQSGIAPTFNPSFKSKCAAPARNSTLRILGIGRSEQIETQGLSYGWLLDVRRIKPQPDVCHPEREPYGIDLITKHGLGRAICSAYDVQSTSAFTPTYYRGFFLKPVYLGYQIHPNGEHPYSVQMLTQFDSYPTAYWSSDRMNAVQENIARLANTCNVQLPD